MVDLLEICCGLDVHKDSIVACLMKGNLDHEPIKEIREFSTLRSGITELKEWLEMEMCRDIAMESTGVYWFSVYHVLETMFDGEIRITVTNPMHMKNVPGKKTDVNDAQWIASLLRAGLLRSSYIPPREIRELRDLTRYRKAMVQEMSAQKNRIEKQLQQSGFKLSTFLTDIFGMSGRSIKKYLCKYGEIRADKVITHLHGTARKKENEIKQAVNGKMSDHQRMFLTMLLEWLEHEEEQIAIIEKRLDELFTKYESALTLLTSIPGIERRGAMILISEIGVDLSVFKNAGQLCAWAGMCPGNYESAGKKSSTRALKGNSYIKNVLCQCAWAISRKRNIYFSNWFWKVKQRRGAKRAVMALGRKMLTIVYVLLTTGERYNESAFDQMKEKQDVLRKNRLIAEASKYGMQLVMPE